ncbi:uncharacterized protein PAC_20112 [Phialocephala subalpina]|uniref:Uncharacterized protein n=1 Tax=Phialocephala subalpina TaxID=576137 RepID=A0A1L7XYR8_9HELO|nr:uncharacterized protein PAC_20112 [Phialocephala subalpina]
MQYGGNCVSDPSSAGNARTTRWSFASSLVNLVQVHIKPRPAVAKYKERVVIDIKLKPSGHLWVAGWPWPWEHKNDSTWIANGYATPLHFQEVTRFQNWEQYCVPQGFGHIFDMSFVYRCYEQMRNKPYLAQFQKVEDIDRRRPAGGLHFRIHPERFKTYEPKPKGEAGWKAYVSDVNAEYIFGFTDRLNGLSDFKDGAAPHKTFKRLLESIIMTGEFKDAIPTARPDKGLIEAANDQSDYETDVEYDDLPHPIATSIEYVVEGPASTPQQIISQPRHTVSSVAPRQQPDQVYVSCPPGIAG